jgi:MinD-like ATPase involved in chromosome partitioning or flagellar assembly
MDRKPFFILVASQKGGVGKTAVALNLGVALRYHNFKVLLVDSDTESASATEQLGIKVEGKGYADVVRGEANISDVVFAYEPIDLYVIPGGESANTTELDPKDVEAFFAKLSKLDYDFIIVDSAPGLFISNITKYINDVIILTTPDSVSSAGSSKMSRYCEKYRLEHRLVINRIGYSKFDLDKDQIEKLYGDVSFQTIPEDKIVSESVFKHKPAYLIDRNANFSLAIEDLAREYSLKQSDESGIKESEFERETQPGVFEKLAKWFLGYE